MARPTVGPRILDDSQAFTLGSTVTPRLHRDIFCEAEWSVLVTDLRLSRRQQEVVRLLMAGKTDQQIASELRITVPTLRTHLSRLFQKLEVEDRLGIVLHVFWRFRCLYATAECHHKQ